MCNDRIGVNTAVRAAMSYLPLKQPFVQLVLRGASDCIVDNLAAGSARLPDAVVCLSYLQLHLLIHLTKILIVYAYLKL